MNEDQIRETEKWLKTLKEWEELFASRLIHIRKQIKETKELLK